MHYLYGRKPGVGERLVATFDSEQQLLAYVRWATLSEREGICKFEQGSSLAGHQGWAHSTALRTGENAGDVDHNPTPSML